MLKQQHRPDNTPVYLQLPCASNAAAVFRTLASLFDGRHATEPGQSGPAYLRVTHRNNPAAARVSQKPLLPIPCTQHHAYNWSKDDLSFVLLISDVP